MTPTVPLSVFLTLLVVLLVLPQATAVAQASRAAPPPVTPPVQSPSASRTSGSGPAGDTSVTAPRQVSALVARGRERLAVGDWAGALAVLEPGLEKGADDPELHSALARAYSELGEDAPRGGREQAERYRKALEHAQRGLDLAPDSPQAHVDVAVVTGKIAGVSGPRTKLRLAPAVAEHARRAIELDPGSWEAYHVLGEWNVQIATLGGLKRLGASLLGGLPEASLEEAVANFEKARELAPGSIRNRLALGRAYLEADREEEARAELEAAASLPPSEPRDPALQREARDELADLDS